MTAATGWVCKVCCKWNRPIVVAVPVVIFRRYAKVWLRRGIGL